jgi:non-heme chloroperoxidase
MGSIHVGTENSDSITLHYEDHGVGTPVVLIHAFPLSGQSWEKQIRALVDAGYRVIAYDRRGFGQSSRPGVGYDFDTFAHDLDIVLTQLDLQDAALVGHGMGTGEVTRYLATYGSARVRKAAMLAPLPPFLLRTADNLEGVHQDVFDRIMRAITVDRPAYMKALLDDCFNVDVLGASRVSEQDMQLLWNVAASASARGTLDCVQAWLTDFRQDLPGIDVPVLIVQGDQDRIFPIHVTGRRLPALMKDAQFMTIQGGPHALIWTHASEVNRGLLDFLGHEEQTKAK